MQRHTSTCSRSSSALLLNIQSADHSRHHGKQPIIDSLSENRHTGWSLAYCQAASQQRRCNHKSNNHKWKRKTKIWHRFEVTFWQMTGKKNSNSVIFIFFLLWQIHGSHPSSAWTSRIRDKSKFSEPQRQASYDFKRVQFALNVHTDATDDEQGLSVLPTQAIMHYFISAAASGPVCFLYTLSLSIITEARALTLGQFKKLSRLILLQSVLHSKHPLTYNLKRSLFQ